ncbi:hypothetical protein ACFWWT_35930 [Streptomyces sp. NPDC058676]|uniref:hypothetical protein n=1 Tax=unclassified Streptomyces TaxID=2593676 RepID=UPI0036683297
MKRGSSKDSRPSARARPKATSSRAASEAPWSVGGAATLLGGLGEDRGAFELHAYDCGAGLPVARDVP